MSVPGGTEAEIPSMMVYNSGQQKNNESTLYILAANNYVNTKWEMFEKARTKFEFPQRMEPIDNSVVAEDTERDKDQLMGKEKPRSEEQKNPNCPFGIICSQIHNPCQVFKPIQFKKQYVKTEKFNIYSCNVRSINNKKESVAAILKNNDIDICILSELSTQNMPRFKGYTNFECLKKRRNHGICILVQNHLREDVIRIAEEELEIVHLRFENTTPALNVIGVYLDVEANLTVEDLKSAWFKFKNRVDFVLDKGEALVTLGDFNRPIDNPKVTCGKNFQGLKKSLF